MYTIRAQHKTFWNELRVAQGASIIELADTYGVSRGTISNWFIGKYIPPDNVISKLCTRFNVDVKVGQREFRKAHKQWVKQHGDDIEQVSIFDTITEADLATFDTPEPEIAAAEPVEEDTDVDLCRILYGKLSFEDYERFRAAAQDGNDPVEFLYGKISFSEFNELLTLIGR